MPEHTRTRPSPAPRPLRELGYLDAVDFVERTTYEIWNHRRPEAIRDCYAPYSVIHGDGGDLVGTDRVLAVTTATQTTFPDYLGVIQDTIWTGDDLSGYRTSMRWVSRGTHHGPGAWGEPTGRVITNSCIANCVIVGGVYAEEWGVGNGRFLAEQLDRDVADAARRTIPTGAVFGAAGREATRGFGAAVPAIPARVDGPGLFVVELLDRLYNHRDTTVADKLYAPGAPYVFGASRYRIGPAGVRTEVADRLRLLPDLELSVEELYWNHDTRDRARVAVRYLLTGTATVNGTERPVSLTGVHHIHVRGDLVVAEWSELDELALHRQLYM
ncbi:ester cyclase [Streptomyces sp. NPDC001661]